MSKRIIEPGLLVSLNSQVRGNTKYYRQQLEYAHLTAVGEERSRHETTKIVRDPVEQKAGSKVRDKCRSLIKSVCTQSDFGLLCPQERESDLEERVAEALGLAAAFNAEAVYTHVSVNVFWGTVAQDNVRATQAITSEVTRFMEEMQTGLIELDVKKVRKIAAKARQMGQVLTPEAKTAVNLAVRTARASATRLAKVGEAVVGEIDREAIRTIGQARTSFLEFDFGPAEVAVPVMSNGRALELGLEAL